MIHTIHSNLHIHTSSNTYQIQENTTSVLPYKEIHTKSKKIKISNSSIETIPQNHHNHYHTSLWKLQQNELYMQFLKANEKLFKTSKIQRKKSKINIQMSKYILTRSSDQCRSHHQKMIKHHQSIPNIIQYIQNLLIENHLKIEKQYKINDKLQVGNIIQIFEEQLWKNYQNYQRIFDWRCWLVENEQIWEEKKNQEWLEQMQEMCLNQ